MHNLNDHLSLNRTIVENYYGKIVTDFSRADFMNGGVEDAENFGPLQIKFNDASFLKLEINGDAESINFSNDPIYFGKSEMETYWKEIHLNNRVKFSELINCKLIRARCLKNSFEDREWICGCILYFDNGKSIAYFNYYDDAKVTFDEDKLLESFIEYENLAWVD